MKVFLVEDSAAAVKMLELALTKAGYEVLVASDGQEALARIPVARPDLIIMDIMMPNMDGIEATRRLRADSSTASIPIIMLTARDRIEDKLSGFGSGADDYVVKPILPAELVARVNALMRRAQRVGAPPEERGRTFGFLGVKGGVGTTMLAVNVAVAMAQGGKKVILADMHPWGGTAALQLGILPRAEVGQLADKEAIDIGSRLIEDQLERHRSGVRVFAVPLRATNRIGELAPDKLLAVLDRLETMAEAVIVDMGSGVSPTSCALAQRCHTTVLALEPDAIALMLTVDTIKRLEEVGLAGSRLGLVVVSRARAAQTYTREEMEQQLGTKLIGLVTPAPEIQLHALKTGTPVVIGQADSIAAVQMRELSSRLL